MRRVLPEFEYSQEQLNTINALARKTGLCADTVKILYGRGADTEEKIKIFLHPSKAHFISPFKMSGMREAVSLITRAKNEGWTVVIYGDYDADGVCASAIMRAALKDFGIEPVAYVPERRKGYGLTVAAIDEIFEEYFPQLVITVDCGISNAREIEYIKEQGAEVIVTDHHELPDKLPDCVCVNPKFNDGYIYDNLCGAGVAFKVGCALNGESAYSYLDLAAIATVADSVPLTGENRDIVAEGLKLINKTPKKCYADFLKQGETVTAQSISFSVAPKINAAGRMGDANAALALFCEEDEKRIFDLSVKLTAYNQERQKCCEDLYLSAKEKLKERGAYGRVIMLCDESWNTGFVGIVAARLAEEYARPALLFVRNGDMLKGSARSVESVNIFEALKSCENLIEEFGGHSQAAGVNIRAENFSLLEESLDKFLHGNYSADAFTPTYFVSGELKNELSHKFVKELEMLEPFGVGNKRPLFYTDAQQCAAKFLKPLSPHLSVQCGGLECVYFNGARYGRLLSGAAPKRLVFEYSLSTFRGKEYIRGLIRDVIYLRNAGKFVPQDIACNNLTVAALPDIRCTVKEISFAECEKMLSEKGEYGTVFIVNEYATLPKYANLSGKQVDLFCLSSKNLSVTVLLSPQPEIDLSGFRRVVYLDKPARLTLPSLAGKEIYVCKELRGTLSLRRIDTRRYTLAKQYLALKAQCGVTEGETAEEAAKNCDLGTSPVQTLFALKVFEELKIIAFKQGRTVMYRGIKTQLNKSQLYNLIDGSVERV